MTGKAAFTVRLQDSSLEPLPGRNAIPSKRLDSAKLGEGDSGVNKLSEANWNEEDFGEELVKGHAVLFARLVEIEEIDDGELADQEEVRRFANLARGYDD